MDAVLQAVRDRIQQLDLSWGEAASEIGVTESSLRRHLGGAYVRSDSLAKYRRWVSGLSRKQSPQIDLLGRESVSNPEPVPPPNNLYVGPKPSQASSYRVVDLFSGCGGLSLGFDLFEGSGTFRTVLAVDIEDAMVRAYNANHPIDGRLAICRKIDIADFVTEAEVLAVYLDHLAEIEGNKLLRQRLNSLPVMRLDDFRARIVALDQEFIRDLLKVRESDSYLRAYRGLNPQILNQTSVDGFHSAIKLPATSSSRAVDLGPIIWAGDGRLLEAPRSTRDGKLSRLQNEVAIELEAVWRREVEALSARCDGQGRGQLASSSARIAAFVSFLHTDAMAAVRQAWLVWRSRRDALRFRMFSDPKVLTALRGIYEDGFRVSVVLGGPPCQGFSRIGRGKIRSLRDDRVHVHYDEDAGDVRNRLLHKYVLFVNALAPDAFLFENVRHFQSKVQTPTGTYLATDVLAEAIRNVAAGGPTYHVAQKIVNASEHLIPQKRERFFMIGIRDELTDRHGPAWCLHLPLREPVPLRAALDGLPDPYFVGDREQGTPPLARILRRRSDVIRTEGAVSEYRNWIEQPPPAVIPSRAAGEFDGHCARPARRDDAALFELMGPGTRWMDYRADESTTITELRVTLTAVLSLLTKRGDSELSSNLDVARVRALLEKVDGSLALRLLLESIEPLTGELQHHLLTENYLSKREGNHGDWLARLHPDEPCKTIVTHMGKDTYAYVHPTKPRTLSVREAARVQSFPDWFRLGDLSLVDAFRVIGNAVPPLLASQFAERIARVLWTHQIDDATVRPTSDVAPVAAFG